MNSKSIVFTSSFQAPVYMELRPFLSEHQWISHHDARSSPPTWFCVELHLTSPHPQPRGGPWFLQPLATLPQVHVAHLPGFGELRSSCSWWGEGRSEWM